jgi:hypothetical protein
MVIKLNLFAFFTFISALLFAQSSSSVMDASYFSSNQQEAPVRAGKGFDIRDVFKQTRNCFTKESSAMSLLKALQQGQKTSITLHYTKNDDEYNLLQRTSSEGKVSYLNLFSFGTSYLKEYTSRVKQTAERLTFIAKVDFGKFEFDDEPKLTSDAQNLINQKKFNDFISVYGTHYVSGVRKESSIWITLTKKSEETTENTNVGTSDKVKAPLNIGVNFQVNNKNEFSRLLKNQDYAVSVQIYGPSIESTNIQDNVEFVMSNEEEKVAGIEKLLRSAFTNISNPTQSLISQYYYTPFTLYGVEGINWDKAKEQELTNINEQVIKVFSLNNQIDTIIENNGVVKELTSLLEIDPKDAKDPYFKKKIEEYRKNVAIKVNYVKTFKPSLDTTLTFLEKVYQNCSNIDCSTTQNCCRNGQSINVVKERVKQTSNAITDLQNTHTKFIEELFSDLITCDCNKRSTGTILIENKSTNPYDIYIKDELHQTIEGRKTGTIKCIRIGDEITFKAVQKSGYMMYPTTNIRRVKIRSLCEEVLTKVGFED